MAVARKKPAVKKSVAKAAGKLVSKKCAARKPVSKNAGVANAAQK